MTTVTAAPRSTHSTTRLWQGALATAVLAGLAPRVNAVMYDHERIWHLDSEARVLLPIVVVLPLVIASALGVWAWRGSGNRPALVGMVLSIVSVLGVVAFWISAPIVLGGLAATLGVEGRRRAAEGRGRMASVAVALGLLACVCGTALWLAGA